MADQRNGISPVAPGMANRKAKGAAFKPPVASGLFDPQREHDACGVGFIVNLRNVKSQRIVQWDTSYPMASAFRRLRKS